MIITFNEAITAGLGVVFTIIGLNRRNMRIRMLKTGTMVDGEVVDIKRVLSNDTESSGYTYSPVIKYTTVEERSVIKAYEITSYPCPYKIGDKLKVIYDHDDDEQFILNDSPSLFIETVFFGAGIVLLICTAVQFFM